MKRIVAALLVTALLPSAAYAGEAQCLRSDNVKQIKMTGADRAQISDKQSRLYEVTFVGSCGARHSQVYFVLRHETMPACIGVGTALPTNSEGACVVKTISAKS